MTLDELLALPEDPEPLDHLPREDLDALVIDLEIEVTQSRADYLRAKRNYDLAFAQIYLVTEAFRERARAQLHALRPDLLEASRKAHVRWFQLTQLKERAVNTISRNPHPVGRPVLRTNPEDKSSTMPSNALSYDRNIALPSLTSSS